MPPEQEPQKPAAAPESNNAPTTEDMATIKAQLEEERKAKTAIEATLAAKDKRITELQASVSVIQQAGDTAMAELTQVKQAHTKAVAKYLDVVKLANPSIPGDVITGTTIDEIDASLKKASSIATAVKANLEAQAKEARVPAGAPTRTEISLEGLSPREKIAAGIHQKGGTS
jgi:vacuolar-type H+-ATPase subunit I/STV1